MGCPLTAACLIAELGDPARFRSAGAIASYIGVAPRLRQSGKKRFSGSPTIPFGNARLRKALCSQQFGAWLLTAGPSFHTFLQSPQWPRR